MTCRSCGRDHVAERRLAIACSRNALDRLASETFGLSLLPDDISARIARRQKPVPEPVLMPWPRHGFQLDVALEMGTI